MLEPISQRTQSQSWLLTSASMPLDVFSSRAQGGGSPGPWVSDLTIIGWPISPAWMRCAAALNSGSKRRMKPTCRITPAFWTAAMISSHSNRLSAMGFSTKTCLPACAAWTASALWVKVGVVMTTASKGCLSSASSREG